jgi:hypothetical protein
MKWRVSYSTASILFLIGWIAVTIGAVQASHRYVTSDPWQSTVAYLCIDSVYWLPLVFLAYFIGRRSFSIPGLIVFAVIQLAMIFVAHYMRLHVHNWWPWTPPVPPRPLNEF